MSDLDGYRSDTACPRCGEDGDRCECPSDLDAPPLCAHGLTPDQWCPECAVAGEMMLSEAVVKALARIDRERDEAMGAAMFARFGG